MVRRYQPRSLWVQPPEKVIGTQPDLFGGPSITHTVPPMRYPRSSGRDFLKYIRTPQYGDLDPET